MIRPIVEKTDGAITAGVIALIGLAGALSQGVRHKGFWHVCHFLGKLIRGRRLFCSIQLEPDSTFKFFLDDAYWSRMISDTYEYEPDFYKTLLKFRDLDFVFVDCGANFGYWSILLSGNTLGNRSAVAIEASAGTYRMLWQNCELNGKRFKCVHRAISDRSGERVLIDTSGDHAGAFIMPRSRHGREHHGENTHHEQESAVETVTLDEVVSKMFQKVPERVLIKLDVEGEEINAFKGAKDLLKRDILFYYEDHGKDQECKVTRYVLEDLGLKVFFCCQNGSFLPITCTKDAGRLKVKRSYGYNFFACHPGSRFLVRMIQEN